jgi:hypothetical protein
MLKSNGSALAFDSLRLLGGTAGPCGLPQRARRGGACAAHAQTMPGAAIPVGYLDAWGLPMKAGALGITADRVCGAIGSAVAKCLSRIAVTGLCGASVTIHTLRLRWRTATGGGVATGGSGTKCLSRMTCTGEIGARPSAQDIAYAVWGAPNAIALGFTAGRVMRGLAAVNLGKKSGDTFRDVTDTTDQVTGTTTPAGDRTAVTVGA